MANPSLLLIDADALIQLVLARINQAPKHTRSDARNGVMWPTMPRAWLMKRLQLDEKQLIEAFQHLEQEGFLEFELRGHEYGGHAIAIRMRSKMVERVA